MASALTDPVLLFFVAALLGSSFLFANGRAKDGAEGTLRMLDGSLAFTITGILASGWTWVIYNDMVRNPLGGEFCATEGLVQCGSVIGDPRYNNLFGMSWGSLGLAAFAALFFLILCLRMDMHAKWVSKYVNYAWWMGLAGVPFLFLLIGIEIFVVNHICPFCTVAHLALIGYLVTVWRLRERRENSAWHRLQRLNQLLD